MQIIQSNNAFNKIFRNNIPDELLLDFTEIIKPYDINRHLPGRVQSVVTNRKSFLNDQITIDLVSGDKRIFDVSCIPLPTLDDSHVVLVMHDITIHKQVEREREDLIGFVAH